jgi:hypothetical protein
MTFRLWQAKYNQENGQAYVELRATEPLDMDRPEIALSRRSSLERLHMPERRFSAPLTTTKADPSKESPGWGTGLSV